jgi:hypothetical protein
MSALGNPTKSTEAANMSMVSNDEIERREVALSQNEADLSQSSTSLLGSPKKPDFAIARPDC